MDVEQGRVSLPVRAEVEARLRRRYQRFFADVETADGLTLTVHCPNPGSMRGLLREGAPVRCSTSGNPRRRLRHTLEMIRPGRAWVGLHTGRANAVVERALRAAVPGPLAGYGTLRREVPLRLSDERRAARIDFVLEGHSGDPRPLYLEVKSVTLARGRTACFPDSVTERGRRHAELLGRLADSGARAALLFLVQRADCDRVEPADDIDPAYGAALRRAAALGVEVFALGARVSPRGIRVERTLPVLL